jgi:hypothetical protein
MKSTTVNLKIQKTIPKIFGKIIEADLRIPSYQPELNQKQELENNKNNYSMM